MHRERHGRGWQNDGIFPFKLTRGTPTAQILSPLARVVPLPISTITKTRRIRAAMRRGPRAFTGIAGIALHKARTDQEFTISCIPTVPYRTVTAKGCWV